MITPFASSMCQISRSTGANSCLAAPIISFDDGALCSEIGYFGHHLLCAKAILYAGTGVMVVYQKFHLQRPPDVHLRVSTWRVSGIASMRSEWCAVGLVGRFPPAGRTYCRLQHALPPACQTHATSHSIREKTWPRAGIAMLTATNHIAECVV